MGVLVRLREERGRVWHFAKENLLKNTHEGYLEQFRNIGVTYLSAEGGAGEFYGMLKLLCVFSFSSLVGTWMEFKVAQD